MCQRWGNRRAGEGRAGELPAKRWKQPGQEKGSVGDTGVPGEKTPLSIHGLWEDVWQVVPPQSPPKGPHW